MPTSRRIERLGPALAFVFAAFVLLFGLGRHGIWDPTELAVADTVRNHGTFDLRPPWHAALVARGFALFGVHDWSGRLFGAVACLVVVGVAIGLARRHGDSRTATYAGVLAVGTPLLVLNGRWMIGDAAALAAHSLVGLGLFLAAFDRTDADRPATARSATSAIGLVLAAIGAVVAVLVRGALLGVLPPLLAIAGITLIEPRAETPRRTVRIVIAALGLALTAVIAFLVVRDAAAYSLLLGGSPGGGSPPSFERFLQTAFHTLAPASAVFVLGASRSITALPDDTSTVDAATAAEDQRQRTALVLWAVFAWAAATLFASRYGTASFLAAAPIAVLAAMTLREAEVGRPIDLGGALIVAMLLGLLIRDFALYPASPLAAVPVPPPTLPPDFQPRLAWAALLGGFAASFFLGAASRLLDGGASFRDRLAFGRELLTVRLPRLLRENRFYALLAAVALVAELALVVVGIAGDRFGIASIAVRVTRVLAIVLPLLPIVVPIGLDLALRGFSKLGGARMLPAVLFAAGVGVFLQGPFLQLLSSDLSPREVYETYNQLRGPRDELVEYQIGSRASAYYATGTVRSVTTEDALIEYLSGEGRRWAIFRRSSLPEFDRHFRVATGRHVVIADSRNPDVVLATNRALENRADENPIVAAVRSGEVHPQFPVHARLDSLELVGYDLQLPNGNSVGAGQSFRITWYWKVLEPLRVDWRVFVHIDGAGLRLNGDHDPVEGLLPTRQWVVGDTIADTQELSVPPSYPSQPFTIYVGLFSGDTRMTVRSGNHGADNRIVAGTLQVR